MRRSCSDSLLTASQSDGVFGSEPGARGLRSIIEGILLDTMFDLPSLEGVEEVVISSIDCVTESRLNVSGDDRARAETSSGSTSHLIRPRTGSRARSRPPAGPDSKTLRGGKTQWQVSAALGVRQITELGRVLVLGKNWPPFFSFSPSPSARTPLVQQKTKAECQNDEQ